MKSKPNLIALLISLVFCCNITTFYAQSISDYHKQADEKDQKGKFKGAVKLYQKALNLDPNNVEILEKIVFAKSNCSKYNSAIDNLNTLIQLKPKSSKFYYLRGFFQFHLKNYYAAIFDYSKAIEFKEDKIFVYNIYSERGICKMRLKDYVGAIQDFNESLKIFNDPGIIKNKNEAELKLKENQPHPKFKVIETINLHYIYLKNPVLTTN